MKATNIKWDTKCLNFVPREIELPEGMTDRNVISDYISNVTGFRHKGFTLEESIPKEKPFNDIKTGEGLIQMKHISAINAFI